MPLSRRQWLALVAGGLSSSLLPAPANAQPPAASASGQRTKDLTIKEVRVTPMALPDPPLLAASGCHGPYFLRTIVEIVTTDGITGVGETNGSQRAVRGAEARRPRRSSGKCALAYRKFTEPPIRLSDRSLCRGGGRLPRRDRQSDRPAAVRAAGRAGPRGSGVRGVPVLPLRRRSSGAAWPTSGSSIAAARATRRSTSMAKSARPKRWPSWPGKFHQKFGYRVHKLKGGVLKPEVELEALKAISSRFGGKHLVRIDPNARWSLATSLEDRPRHEGPAAGVLRRPGRAGRKRWPRSAARPA